MEYMKPFGQFVEFDNSDIIVTSNHDMPCNSRYDGRMFCTSLGDSELDNECHQQGGWVSCTLISNSDDEDCTNRYNHRVQCSQTNFYYFNAPRPIPKD